MPAGRACTSPPKAQASLRLDQDVIAAFRAQGPGWQSRMNEALRKAAEAGSAIGFYLKPLLEEERVDMPVVKRAAKRPKPAATLDV